MNFVGGTWDFLPTYAVGDDNWQADYNNLAGHTAYSGAAPIDSDSAYSNTSESSAMTKGLRNEILVSVLCGKLCPSNKQVLWLVAPNPAKIHWLQVARSNSTITSANSH